MLSFTHLDTEMLTVTCYTDIDECLDGSDQCAANATCNNTDGGYNCSCNIGYEGDGFECLSKFIDDVATMYM